MEHCEDIRTAIQAGKTALGIELGSTRIKAVLIDENHNVLASGQFSWENRLENGLSKNRIGISVSKKVGNSVVRHHMCRLIRESYRLNEKSIKPGYDLVVVVRPLAKGRSYREIESALLHLMKLQDLYRELSSENQDEKNLNRND